MPFARCAWALCLALLWAAYQFRMRQLQHAFDVTLEARVGGAHTNRPRAS